MNLLEQNPTATEYKHPLVIYHGNCADGFSAAWCFFNAQEKMDETFEFFAGTYGKPAPDCTGRVVHLVDFSYPIDILEEICAQAIRVILIDHHQTAIEATNNWRPSTNNFYRYVDINRSGAMLAWDWIHNLSPEGDRLLTGSNYTEPPLLLDHIQDRDLWKFRLPGTKEISEEVFSWEYTFENWDRLMNAGPVELMKMTVSGGAILRKHMKDVHEIIKVAKRFMPILFIEVPVVSVPYFMASDCAGIMAKEYQEGKLFAAAYYDTATHRVFSLRSAPEGSDVAKIAQAYGGGGHKHAAGFSVPRDHELARM